MIGQPRHHAVACGDTFASQFLSEQIDELEQLAAVQGLQVSPSCPPIAIAVGQVDARRNTISYRWTNGEVSPTEFRSVGRLAVVCVWISPPCQFPAYLPSRYSRQCRRVWTPRRQHVRSALRATSKMVNLLVRRSFGPRSSDFPAVARVLHRAFGGGYSELKHRPRGRLPALVFTHGLRIATGRDTRVVHAVHKEEQVHDQSIGKRGNRASPARRGRRSNWLSPGDRTYVVPVCYAYQDGAIYAHSAYGQKIEMMRQNPRVCFEVDHVEDLVNWNSAICWGTYEELQGAEAEHALRLLRERLSMDLPRILEHGELAAEAAAGDGEPVVYRIHLTETSGREERLHWELLPGPQEVFVTTSFQSTPGRELAYPRAGPTVRGHRRGARGRGCLGGRG